MEFGALKAFSLMGKPKLSVACIYIYIYTNCVSAAMVYMDWLPEFLKGDKTIF
jgi:hypothetical protein